MKKIVVIIFLLLSVNSFGQSLSVFDIDTTSFPIMKAKFYAFDADGEQILDLSPKDFEITEDGEPREVTFVSCPTTKPPEPISSVLTIDISGSMSGDGIKYAKEAAKTWINAIQLGESECAITTFNSRNFFKHDFTTDKKSILNSINNLSAKGGTDFDAAFINPMSGALLAAENGKYKKVVILLTDGYCRE